jgi:hypothetical protein
MKPIFTDAQPCLSAVFVDYDNIYLSLKRKSDDAARRFARDASLWLRAIEQGTLITPTNGPSLDRKRRIVMNRCYGNPVPRRNASDNSTDMNSFPFVRHHFLRGGFEIVDCPPLTAQLKNSSDIRMVMDVRDFLHHDTYFEEFVILSGDADFTPVLHRLRAHARRTVIFANDYTAAPYTAISDGEIRESDLIQLLLEGKAPAEGAGEAQPAAAAPPKPITVTTGAAEQPETVQAKTPAPVTAAKTPAVAVAPAAVATPGPAEANADHREEIVANVLEAVRAAGGPVPIEMLADRAVRALGTEKTSGSAWAGAGTFRNFLIQHLPQDVRITDQAPYFAYDTQRHGSPEVESPPRAVGRTSDNRSAVAARIIREPGAGEGSQSSTSQAAQARANVMARQQTATTAPAAPARRDDANVAIRQAIARIYEACQAPRLGPIEYRTLFELMALELNENKLSGAQTITNVLNRAHERNLPVERDDIRFVFDVVAEVDPWFDQGASANLFAGRFRNFVVARCRTQGLNLSADDIDLIDRLFASGLPSAQTSRQSAGTDSQQQPAQRQAPSVPAPAQPAGQRWWGGSEDGRAAATQQYAPEPAFAEAEGSNDELPRIVRSRMRG